MKILDGKSIASNITNRIGEEIALLEGRKPGLAFVLVGNNPASELYVQMKKKKSTALGMRSFDIEFPQTISQRDLLTEIQALNKNPDVDGILIQLPLPEHLAPFTILEAVDPRKDVDGFHPTNMGKLLIGEHSGFIPCTPYGVQTLLTHTEIPVTGKHVVIIGRSQIVGKPLAALLMQKAAGANATVTVVHSLTENLPQLCRSADILIAAIGQPRFVTKEMVKPGAVIVDVGINRTPGSKEIVGDVDFEHVAPIASYISPVPGGVGPMTIAMLMSNTLLSYENRTKTRPT